MPADATHRAAVLGAGSWGTALAVHLGHIGHDVTLWGRDHALLAEMASRRANPTYLPDLTFPETVRPTPQLSDALSDARLVIVAVPSHGLRLVMRAAAPYLPAGAVLVSATKGIETDTLARMSEVMNEDGSMARVPELKKFARKHGLLMHRGTANATFTVRKVSFGQGVERIFPLHSPTIDKIEVVRSSQVRRAKLYFLRELKGKAARMKETKKA